MNPFAVGANGKAVTVRFTGIQAPWEQWLLLRSDAHHDSRLCNRELETEHLQLAKARDALILDMGDCFDGMQSKHDKRRSYDELRPENLGLDYYGSIVEHAAADYEPYAGNWLLLARGNHEMSALNHANLDLTSLLADKLRKSGSAVIVGRYEGWVVFTFQIQKTVMQSVKMRYYHGAGANSPVTRGVIDTARQAVFLPDADLIVNGHNHQNYILAMARERISRKGKIWQDLAYYIRIPGYKGRGAWEIEKGHAPAPHGCAWVRLWLDSKASMVRYEVTMELR